MSMSPFYRKMRVKETAHVEKLATMTITSDTTLQPEDSGKVIFMGKNGVDITLPDPPFEGFNVKIILNEDNATAACTVTCNGTGEFLQVLSVQQHMMMALIRLYLMAVHMMCVLSMQQTQKLAIGLSLYLMVLLGLFVDNQQWLLVLQLQHRNNSIVH